MFKLRLHANLTAYTPAWEFVVRPEIVTKALAELSRELEDGALKSVEVEEPNGSVYRIKRR